MPPVSSIWIPGRRWALASDHPAGRNPAGGHARERRGGAGRRGPGRQGAGGCGCPERPSSCSGITLSDEGGQGERARTCRYLYDQVTVGSAEGGCAEQDVLHGVRPRLIWMDAVRSGRGSRALEGDRGGAGWLDGVEEGACPAY